MSLPEYYLENLNRNNNSKEKVQFWIKAVRNRNNRFDDSKFIAKLLPEAIRLSLKGRSK